MKKLFPILSALLVFPSVAFGFSDIPSNHWASFTVQWATDQKISRGYADGTFRPDSLVTEAEFLALLVNTFEGVQSLTNPNHWASGYYDFVRSKNWAPQGLSDYSFKDKPIYRHQVAELISSADGVHFSHDLAVAYVLGKGLAKGKVAGDLSTDSFRGYDPLTRAEALQFVKNLKDSGMKILRSRPRDPSLPDLIPKTVRPPITSIPTLHPLTTAEMTPLQRSLGERKLPKDPISQPAIESFLKSIKFDRTTVTFTIPALPKGYRASYVWNADSGKGLVDVRPGQVIKHDYVNEHVDGFAFFLYKGYVGMNGLSVAIPSGAYSYGAIK